MQGEYELIVWYQFLDVVSRTMAHALLTNNMTQRVRGDIQLVTCLSTVFYVSSHPLPPYGAYGVVVSMFDFHSSYRGSNPGFTQDM